MTDATQRRFKVRLLVPVEITVTAETPAQAAAFARSAYNQARADLALQVWRYRSSTSAVFCHPIEPTVEQVAPAYEPPTAQSPGLDANGAEVLP